MFGLARKRKNKKTILQIDERISQSLINNIFVTDEFLQVIGTFQPPNEDISNYTLVLLSNDKDQDQLTFVTTTEICPADNIMKFSAEMVCQLIRPVK